MALPASVDARKSTTGAAVHNVVPSQETGYNLSTTGKSEGIVGSRLSGVSGSNYPDVRLRVANLKPPLCTSSAAYSSRKVSGLDRPDRAETRCKLPRKSRVRSNETALSVLEKSHTKYESLSVSNGAASGPTSSDHLKLETPPTGNSFRARGGLNRGAVSGPPSKDRVFSPPVVANHTLRGNGNNGNTKIKVRRSGEKRRTTVDKMPTIFERDAAVSPDECVDVSNTTSNAQSINSSSSSDVQRGDFSRTPGMPDSIHALEPTSYHGNHALPAAFPHCPARAAKGERADHLPEFTRAVGGSVTLDRRRHTARARVFGGSKTTRTQACTVQLDTGSPATFIQHKVWQRMLACGAASPDGLTEISERKWGGFHGIPLITSSRVRLNIEMGGDVGIAPGEERVPTVCLAAHAHVVPDEAMTHAILLGRDGWSEFPIRKYVDISENETVVTFTGSDSATAETTQRYSDWVNSAVGLVEPHSSTTVVARFSGKRNKIPDATSWVKIDITNTDGTAATDGMYYIRFNKGWLPREAVVEAGTSEIPFRHEGGKPYLMQPGMKLGIGGAPLIKSDLAKAQFTPTPSDTVHVVDTAKPQQPCEPPVAVLENLDETQRAAFVRLWRRVPPHLHEIKFDFEKTLWTAADIDALGDLLCR